MARPYQVNGPRQFLTTPGGVGAIRQVAWNGRDMVLNDDLRIVPLMSPDTVAASSFSAGADPQALLATAARRRPASESLSASDDDLTSGVLFFEIELQPGQTRQVGWVTAMAGGPLALAGRTDGRGHARRRSGGARR